MLKLNMDAAFEVEITGAHPAFVGTPFAGADFKIRVRPLNRTQIADLGRKHQKVHAGRTVVDDTAVAQEVFVQSVVSWEGIVDQNGTPLECDAKGKRAVALVHWSFASLVTTITMESQVERETAKDEEVGNSSGLGSGA